MGSKLSYKQLGIVSPGQTYTATQYGLVASQTCVLWTSDGSDIWTCVDSKIVKLRRSYKLCRLEQGSAIVSNSCVLTSVAYDSLWLPCGRMLPV